ncbi:MAG: flagellar hook-associated protein FlgK, partial [Lachnospiraceae bacterium]|nr:flagellar hook-associated protein FlgK [Lachnospiraceae bacterium]
MASTFFGLNIATSGIQAAQAGLSVTGHNSSNENTKGYTRQVVEQSAANPLRFYTSYGMVGSGVEITGVNQMRDTYYDVKYRSNEAKLGEYSTKYSYTLQIEDYFNEIEIKG